MRWRTILSLALIILWCVFSISNSSAATIKLGPDYWKQSGSATFQSYEKRRQLRLEDIRPYGQEYLTNAVTEEEGYPVVAAAIKPEHDSGRILKIEKTGKKFTDPGNLMEMVNLMLKDRFFWAGLPWKDSDNRADGRTEMRLLIKRKNKYDRLTDETKYLAVISTGLTGVLFLLPESVTKWDKDSITISNLAEGWVNNVNAGPVMDEDDWFVNYVGHPYMGSAFYILARHHGFGWKGAFLFSTIISTFVWEYGVESMAEIPSIQDLIVTPLAGALLGELLLRVKERIIKNDGRVLGSRILGSASLALIDPAGAAIRRFRKWSKIPGRIKVHAKFFYGQFLTDNYKSNISLASSRNYLPGLRIVFTYK